MDFDAVNTMLAGLQAGMHTWLPGAVPVATSAPPVPEAEGDTSPCTDPGEPEEQLPDNEIVHRPPLQKQPVPSTTPERQAVITEALRKELHASGQAWRPPAAKLNIKELSDALDAARQGDISIRGQSLQHGPQDGRAAKRNLSPQPGDGAGSPPPWRRWGHSPTRDPPPRWLPGPTTAPTPLTTPREDELKKWFARCVSEAADGSSAQHEPQQQTEQEQASNGPQQYTEQEHAADAATECVARCITEAAASSTHIQAASSTHIQDGKGKGKGRLEEKMRPSGRRGERGGKNTRHYAEKFRPGGWGHLAGLTPQWHPKKVRDHT